jgi:hypothetical protein
MVLANRIGVKEKKRLKRRYQEDRTLAFSKTIIFLLSSGVLVCWLVLMQLSTLATQEACANESISSFTKKVKSAIKILSVSLTDPVSENNIGELQNKIDKIISDAEKEGKPIQFGIGILDRNGAAIAGRYVVGTFRKDDFSRYQYVKKAFKQKKIVQDRLYFQDRSELWIVCVPLVQQKEIVGAVVLGFNPMEVKKDYGLTIKEFLALDLNK